jgi:hypothetical protein
VVHDTDNNYAAESDNDNEGGKDNDDDDNNNNFSDKDNDNKLATAPNADGNESDVYQGVQRL